MKAFEVFMSPFSNHFTVFKHLLSLASQEGRQPTEDMAASKENLARILSPSPQNLEQFRTSPCYWKLRVFRSSHG